MFPKAFHVFCISIDRVWYRTPSVLNELDFDNLMEMLDWKLPQNMKVFHFCSNKIPPITNNPVFLGRPTIEVNLTELFEERKGVTLKSRDGTTVPVSRLGSGFIIVTANDGYGKLLKLDDSVGELRFEEFFPISFAQSRKFVDIYHRHCGSPQSHKFSIGLLNQGKLVGVIITSTPKARALDDGFTLELNRCCVLPDQPNACSKLYARAIKTGRGMGYRRFVTYTLISESGGSLKAVGFKLDGITQSRPKGWDHPSRRRAMPERYPTEPKHRWVLRF